MLLWFTCWSVCLASEGWEFDPQLLNTQDKLSFSIFKTPDTCICMKKQDCNHHVFSKIIISTTDGNGIIDFFFQLQGKINELKYWKQGVGD